LTEGVTGHITVRDPDYPDHFWLNPLGISYNQIKVSDLILCSDKGKIVEGKHTKLNHAAFAIHSRIHKHRPDIIAAAHAHSLYGKIWSTQGRLLDPLSQDACAFYLDHALYDEYNGIVLDLSEGDQIAKALGPHKAVILKNHGLITVGASVETAAWWFISLERCCQVQVIAESLKQAPKPISHEVALKTQQLAYSGSNSGALNFQPFLQDIIAQHPELLD